MLSNLNESRPQMEKRTDSSSLCQECFTISYLMISFSLEFLLLMNWFDQLKERTILFKGRWWIQIVVRVSVFVMLILLLLTDLLHPLYSCQSIKVSLLHDYFYVPQQMILTPLCFIQDSYLFWTNFWSPNFILKSLLINLSHSNLLWFKGREQYLLGSRVLWASTENLELKQSFMCSRVQKEYETLEL